LSLSVWIWALIKGACRRMDRTGHSRRVPWAKSVFGVWHRCGNNSTIYFLLPEKPSAIVRCEIYDHDDFEEVKDYYPTVSK